MSTPPFRRWSGAVRARLAAVLLLAVITAALIFDGAPLTVVLLPAAVTAVNVMILVARVRFERESVGRQMEPGDVSDSASDPPQHLAT